MQERLQRAKEKRKNDKALKLASMLDKEYPPYDPSDNIAFCKTKFDPSYYVLGQHVVHIFEVEGEYKWYFGEITKIPPSKLHFWVTYEDGDQIKQDLPEAGFGKIW